MFALAKLSDLETSVKPDEPRQRDFWVAESASRDSGIGPGESQAR